jgi:hypothetical protein
MRQDMNLSEIRTLILIWQIFSPAKVIFVGVGVLLSVCLLRFLLDNIAWEIMTRTTLQAAKDARASQDALVDIFEHIEMFFRRLQIYTEVPSTVEMTEIIIQIMVEVLSILGIAIKEIRQGQMSKCLPYGYVNVD